jgi:hypothetical protein
MSEQKFDAKQIIFHVHGHALSLSPANGYVHGHATPAIKGQSVVTVQRDDKTGKVRILIDKK